MTDKKVVRGPAVTPKDALHEAIAGDDRDSTDLDTDQRDVLGVGFYLSEGVFHALDYSWAAPASDRERTLWDAAANARREADQLRDEQADLSELKWIWLHYLNSPDEREEALESLADARAAYRQNMAASPAPALARFSKGDSCGGQALYW